MAFTVTLSGTFQEHHGCVTIDGTTYSAATTVSVESGTEVEVTVGGLMTTENCEITVNGEVMQSGAGTLTFAVINDVTITMAFTPVYGAYGYYSAEITMEEPPDPTAPKGKHNTLIDGVSYAITKGTVLKDGVAFNIKKGRTLVDGVGFDINVGSSLPESLVELFSGATVITTKGRDSSSTSTVSISVSNYTSGLYYLLSLCNGYMGVYKFKDNTLTQIYRQSTSYGGAHNNAADSIYYSNNGASSASVYGAALILLQFPEWDEETVDTVLGGLSVVERAGRNSSSSSSITLSKADCQASDIVITTRTSYFAVYDGAECVSSVPDEILQYRAQYMSASWSSGIRISGNGGSIIGFTSTALE